MPELTAFASLLKTYHALFKDAKDDNIVANEFILQQLLFASTMLDLSDEVGRLYLFEQLSNQKIY